MFLAVRIDDVARHLGTETGVRIVPVRQNSGLGALVGARRRLVVELGKLDIARRTGLAAQRRAVRFAHRSRRRGRRTLGKTG